MLRLDSQRRNSQGAALNDQTRHYASSGHDGDRS